MDYREELQLGKYLLELAGAEVLKHFQTGMQVEYKEDNSPVTLADKKTEEVLRKAMETRTPDYGIIGEEFGEQAGSTRRQWVIDPIDGTKSFICGVPLFGTLLALLDDGKPVLGLMGLPALNTVMWAVSGQGCFIDGESCGVSHTDSLARAVVLDGSITTMEKMGFGEPWKNLRAGARFHRGWGDCYGYYLVAAGRAEVMADPIAEVWDLAPVSVMITEAGGAFSSLTGGDFIADRSGLGTNGKLHRHIVDMLTPDAEK